MKEIVVDTNVFVSSLLTPRSTSRVILTKITAVVSVFARPKFRLFVPEKKVADLVTLIHQSARIVKPRMRVHACRDPKDNAMLECALEGGVSAIISGDRDIQVLSPFRGIPVFGPKEFLSWFESP